MGFSSRTPNVEWDPNLGFQLCHILSSPGYIAPPRVYITIPSYLGYNEITLVYSCGAFEAWATTTTDLLPSSSATSDGFSIIFYIF